MKADYRDFLEAKVPQAERIGFLVTNDDINPLLKPHQKDMVRWAVAGGRRAVFAAFGLGKSVIQIEIIRLVLENAGGKGLITIPLGMRADFRADAYKLRTGDDPNFTDADREALRAWQAGRPDRLAELHFVRRDSEVQGDGIYLTNYESVRDGRLDPTQFTAASLDEADCLRGFGGTKTFREFMRLFAGDGKTLNARVRTAGVPYRFVATATPSPNEYIELLAYSAYLDIMDVAGAKTRFFKRNSEHADQLTIHPHKEREFWLWVSSWALFVQRPSDLGHSDEGYELPTLDVRWHEVDSDHAAAGEEKDGQGRMFRNVAIGVQDAAAEKRESLPARIDKLMEIRAEDPDEHRLIWHDLEAERHAIERAVPGVVSVYGNQDLDEREEAMMAFARGEIQELAAKPVIAGSGCNFQRHCAWAVFLGIGFKFRDLIQAIHRINRFLQPRKVRIDLIHTEAEREMRQRLERRWAQHDYMVDKMSEIIREFGLSEAAMADEMKRAMGVERVEASGHGYRCVNNDTVDELPRMDSDSVGLILTSIPFSTQYEYSPNYADLGHTDNNAHFFEHMDYITPELLRVLEPGRIAAIHVKDRIVPGGLTDLGFQTVYPFHADCIAHYQRHGFAFMGMKTIVTDVVRENNQTYRLGWSEQCKDATKMGAGMPEYLLLFRKPPSDNDNGYADQPVRKSKEAYSRARWQFDAHGFARSSGDRRLAPEELEGLSQAQIFRMFRDHSLTSVYDFEHDVRIGEHVDAHGWLPSTFMLLQPQSWHPDVWTDITRMRTSNARQVSKGKEMHLCPMQFDIADRVIEQFSMPGETVLDPFAGLMTVPERALLKGREAVGIELANNYWLDGVAYCEAAAREMSMPSLFDFEGEEVDAAASA